MSVDHAPADIQFPGWLMDFTPTQVSDMRGLLDTYSEHRGSVPVPPSEESPGKSPKRSRNEYADTQDFMEMLDIINQEGVGISRARNLPSISSEYIVDHYKSELRCYRHSEECLRYCIRIMRSLLGKYRDGADVKKYRHSCLVRTIADAYPGLVELGAPPHVAVLALEKLVNSCDNYVKLPPSDREAVVLEGAAEIMRKDKEQCPKI